MNLRKLIFTQNACYKAGRTITPKGIMVHSTGANNPNLKRYVGPDDGLLGVNQYANYWNQDKPDSRQVCVHGFIGKLADGSIATYQTLPWNHRGWHGGSGTKGSVNDTHIGFEICEDGLTDPVYFGKVYKEAVELCIYLCKMHNLTEKNIIGHYEGYAQGLASNHGDPKNWFPKHGKSMDTFRADVKAGLSAGNAPTTPTAPGKITVGSIVEFVGGSVYKSADATTATTTGKKSRCKVTATYNGKHPYHCVSEDGGGVYGWVDADKVSLTQSTPSKTATEITVDNAFANGIITDKTYWQNVLDGKATASSQNIKTAFDNAHNKIGGK